MVRRWSARCSGPPVGGSLPVGMALGLILLLLLISACGSSVGAVPGSLQEPRSEIDAVPPQVEFILKNEKVDIETTRYLGSTELGSKYWIAMGGSASKVCLIVEAPSGVGGVSCKKRSQFGANGIRSELRESSATAGPTRSPVFESALLRPDDASFSEIPVGAVLLTPELLTYSTVDTTEKQLSELMKAPEVDENGVPYVDFEMDHGPLLSVEVVK